MTYFTAQPRRRDLVGRLINFDADTWCISNVGVTDEDGFVFLHLVSTTRFRGQKNGRNPVQRTETLHPDMIEACACRPRA